MAGGDLISPGIVLKAAKAQHFAAKATAYANAYPFHYIGKREAEPKADADAQLLYSGLYGYGYPAAYANYGYVNSYYPYRYTILIYFQGIRNILRANFLDSRYIGKRSAEAEAEPKADAQFYGLGGYGYGLGYGYGGYGYPYYGYGYYG